MKKLLFLVPTFFQGGAERVISELSQHLGQDAELVLVLFENKLSFPFRGRVVSLDSPLSRSPLARLWRFFARFARFKKVLAREKPDVVVSAGASANAMSILAHPSPIVRVDMHISASRKGWRHLPFKLFVRLFFKKAGLLMPVSRAIAKDLQETFRIPPEKMKVVYNPVDVQKIEESARQPLPAELESVFAHPVVVTMGRLEPQKGHGFLLRAFALVKEDIPQARLVLLGEGSLREPLELLARELGIRDSVHFLGWQENPFRFLVRAHVFTLSSLWEGLPDVLLEALACGVPIVSADCRSGPREILAPSSPLERQASSIEQGEYGVLVPVGNGELLAGAVGGLLQDLGRRGELSAKARERALEFDISRIVPQWHLLFSQLSQKEAPRQGSRKGV